MRALTGRREEPPWLFPVQATSGRHFLQIPGPTNVPDRVLRAMDNPTIDHRGPDFGKLGKRGAGEGQGDLQDHRPVVIYPASGTGAWEAALANTLSPGDRVLMCETGWFAHLWQEMAERLGLQARAHRDRLAPRRRRRRDRGRAARGQGACDQGGLRRAQRDHHRRHLPHRRGAPRDRRRRPSRAAAGRYHRGLGSIDYRHDEWGVDVTIAGCQKGLMLPPGLSFNAISPKALQAARGAKLPRSYWDWRPMLAANETGYFPYTPATNLLYGLDDGDRHAAGGRAGQRLRPARPPRRGDAPRGARLGARDPVRRIRAHYSSSLTAVRLPEGHSANALRATILEKFNMSLGNGLGQAERPGVPHRPSRRFRRAAAGRHAGRGGDGPRRRRGAAQGGRRAGGDGLPERQRLKAQRFDT